ncbi:hypothetical protein ASC87_28750 [Rhizobacter sp. Root1221]|nr:hypothetical protein ASC87_28750 [Rhizobacter sp. Root1221]
MEDNATMAKPVPRLTPEEIERVIATAWDDRPPFDRVLHTHGLTHGQVVQLLKRELTPSAFKTWTARTRGAPASAARPGPGKRR